MNIQSLCSFQLPKGIGYIHSANVQLKGRKGMLFTYSSNGSATDPGEELFDYRGMGLMHICMFEISDDAKTSRLLWDKELPWGVICGIWWIPCVPMDMDKDGVDEIYYLNNTGNPFSFLHRTMDRLDAETGETTGSWTWPWNTFNERMSLCYRFYIVGGYAHGEPVLVTCQGTYGNMYLQGWNNDHEKRWELVIKAEDPGPRASHITPILDINNDGVDEIMWGERVLSLDDGHEVIDYAPEFHGHSDVVVPFEDYKTGDRYIYTCREDDERPELNNRIVMFRADGSKAWGALEKGHIHTGWVATVLDGYGKIVFAMSQHFNPNGPRLTNDIDGEYFFDALTGKPVDFQLPCYGREADPIDINGDGYSEFIVQGGEHHGDILDRFGKKICNIGCGCMRMGKIIDHPGEQLMVYRGDGLVEILGDADAVDGDIIKHRYSTPYLHFMQKMMATGYNAEGAHISCGM